MSRLNGIFLRRRQNGMREWAAAGGWSAAMITLWRERSLVASSEAIAANARSGALAA